MSLSREEINLLKKLKDGLLDGLVGDELTTTGGSLVWKEIRDGIPRQLKEGPGRRFFNGQENVTIDGVRHVLDEWITDEQRLAFLQKFGFLMKDADVRAYSAKFKPKR